MAWWKRSRAELNRFVKEGYYRFEDFLEGGGLRLGLAVLCLGLMIFLGCSYFDPTFLCRDLGVGLLGCLRFRRDCMEALHPPSFVFILKLSERVQLTMIVGRGKGKR